jgi:hypothetical protein
MKMQFIAAALAIMFLTTSNVFAHSGRTNAEGCHMNHTYGQFHCHQSRTPSYGQQTYCLVVGMEKRCGYAYSTCNQLAGRYGGMCMPN